MYKAEITNRFKNQFPSLIHDLRNKKTTVTALHLSLEDFSQTFYISFIFLLNLLLLLRRIHTERCIKHEYTAQ